MSGPSIIACLMGVACLFAAGYITKDALPRRRNYKASLRAGRLTYMERVSAREGVSNMTGELFVAAFAGVMGVSLLAMGLSRLLG